MLGFAWLVFFGWSAAVDGRGARLKRVEAVFVAARIGYLFARGLDYHLQASQAEFGLVFV